MKKYSKTMNNSEISRVLESEHGLKIHRTSIPNIFKDIELRKREERNRKRRKSSKTESLRSLFFKTYYSFLESMGCWFGRSLKYNLMSEQSMKRTIHDQLRRVKKN